MTERTYTLYEITGVLGESLAEAREVLRLGGGADRAVDLLVRDAVDRLKALPRTPSNVISTYTGADGKQHPVVTLRHPMKSGD